VKSNVGLPRSDGSLSRKGEKASLEEMEVMVDTSLEEMKARMNVFRGKSNKMEATRKDCLGKGGQNRDRPRTKGSQK
jgi:hypothetical protein